MFWTRLATIAVLVALGVLLGALVRRRGPVRGAAALCLGILPAWTVHVGGALLPSAVLGGVAGAALFAGVPLAVVASHAAVRDGRQPLLARLAFVLAVVQALGLAVAICAGILTDAYG